MDELDLLLDARIDSRSLIAHGSFNDAVKIQSLYQVLETGKNMINALNILPEEYQDDCLIAERASGEIKCGLYLSPILNAGYKPGALDMPAMLRVITKIIWKDPILMEKVRSEIVDGLEPDEFRIDYTDSEAVKRMLLAWKKTVNDTLDNKDIEKETDDERLCSDLHFLRYNITNRTTKEFAQKYPPLFEDFCDISYNLLKPVTKSLQHRNFTCADLVAQKLGLATVDELDSNKYFKKYKDKCVKAATDYLSNRITDARQHANDIHSTFYNGTGIDEIFFLPAKSNKTNDYDYLHYICSMTLYRKIRQNMPEGDIYYNLYSPFTETMDIVAENNVYMPLPLDESDIVYETTLISTVATNLITSTGYLEFARMSSERIFSSAKVLHPDHLVSQFFNNFMISMLCVNMRKRDAGALSFKSDFIKRMNEIRKENERLKQRIAELEGSGVSMAEKPEPGQNEEEMEEAREFIDRMIWNAQQKIGS